MAASNPRMRLTVEVLPLTEEDAHGPYRDVALAAFKGRKFALPVLMGDTIEQAWAQIEERYKRNYLTPTEASAFTIKKLQDGYDCDLDISDTIGAIFEGETDPAKRMIRVVPTFIHRDCSVPFTSTLRPASAQKKRRRDMSSEDGNKRRRIQVGALDPNRPVPSTESKHGGEGDATRSGSITGIDNGAALRSRSGSSLVQVQSNQTGNAEYVAIKEEREPSIELGDPIVRTIPEAEQEPIRSPVYPFKNPQVSSPQALRSDSRPRHPVSASSHSSALQGHTRKEAGHASVENAGQHEDDIIMDGDTDHITDSASSSQELPQGPISQISSTPSPLLPAHDPPTERGKDIYEPSSSPDRLRQRTTKLKTYGRFPRTPRLMQTRTGLHNKPRSRSKSTQVSETRSASAHSFQRAKPDEIESTPLNEEQRNTPRGGNRDEAVEEIVMPKITEALGHDVHTPESTIAPKTAKVSSLKKPTQTSFKMPKSINGDNKVPGKSPGNLTASASKVDPKIQTAKTPSLSQSPAPLMKTPGSGQEKLKAMQQERTRKREAQQKAAEQKNAEQIEAQQKETRPKAARSSPKVVIPTTVRSSISTSQPADSKSPEVSKRPQELERPILPKAPPIPLVETSSHNITVGAQETPAPITVTRRSEVPLPGNVTGKNSTTSSVKLAKDNGIKSRYFKLPGPKTKQPVSTFVPTPEPEIRERSVSAAPRSTRRSEVPLPDNIKHLTSTAGHEKNGAGSGSTVPQAVPTRTAVPLPENVRHRYSDDFTSTLTKPGETTAPQSPPGKTVEEPLVLSSGVSSSSSEQSDEEEEDEDGHLVPTTADRDDQAEAHLVQPELATSEEDAAPETADSTEPPKSPEKSDTKSLPWGTQSWSFGIVSQENEMVEKLGEEANNQVEEMALASATRSRSPPVLPHTTDLELEAGGQSESRSTSRVTSTRSSPVISRQPARFLSHSPTPENSSSEDGSRASTPSSEEVIDRKAVIDDEVESGSDSKSESEDSTSSSESEDEDEDVEMADMDADTGAEVDIGPPPPSSPPPLPQLPQHHTASPMLSNKPSIPLVSQPHPQRTKVPLPPMKAKTLSASQPSRPSVSRASQPPSATQVQPIRRATSQFPSIRQQLTAARSAPLNAHKAKAFDPSMQSLGQLAKAKGKKGLMLNISDSSDDESNSESSSDDDGDKGKNAGCTVARK